MEWGIGMTQINHSAPHLVIFKIAALSYRASKQIISNRITSASCKGCLFEDLRLPLVDLLAALRPHYFDTIYKYLADMGKKRVLVSYGVCCCHETGGAVSLTRAYRC